MLLPLALESACAARLALRAEDRMLTVRVCERLADGTLGSWWRRPMGWPLVQPRLRLTLDWGLGSWGSAERQERGGGRWP